MERRISVIIPVYNSEATLKLCLDSIFNLNYSNYEVIVADDGSADKSINIAKNYSCRIISLPENMGAGAARDRGIKEATGEIAAFIDADCIAPKDWLYRINEGLTTDAIGISGRYDLTKNKDMLSRIFLSIWDPANILYKNPRKIIFCQGGNCAFWKSILMKNRPKKELLLFRKMAGGEDTIMCSELNKFGKLLYDPGIFVTHNKVCSLVDIFKKSVKAGYTGITVSSVCRKLLMKEPYRVYKLTSYVASLMLFFTILLSGKSMSPISFFIATCYMIIHTPIMIKAYRQLSIGFFVVFYPIAIFFVNMAYFLGQIKRAIAVFLNVLENNIWRIKFIANIINPRKLSKLFYFVTKECNANCKFCFNKSKEEINKKGENLTLEEVKGITKKIGFLPFLTITGGEPFLREDIYEICREFYLNCSTRLMTIVTNGTRHENINDVAERILVNCPNIRLTILVALDDINEKHDLIKGIKNCYREASLTLDKLQILKLRFPNLTIGINTMLIDENSDSIEGILNNFRNSFQYDRQSLNLLREPPRTSNESRFIKLERYFELVTQANGKFSRTRLAFWGKMNQAFLKYCHETALKEFKLKRSHYACTAAKKFFVMSNIGDVFPCELLPELLGNIRKEGYDLKKIFCSKKTNDAQTKISDNHCYCQWPCAITSNALFDFRAYINLFKKIILNCVME